MSWWNDAADPLPRKLLRLLRVGFGTGLVQQQTLGSALTFLRLLKNHPLGPGISFAINAAAAPDRPAVIDPTGTLSYAEMDGRINQIVYGLRDLGLRRRDRLAIMSPNSARYLAAFFCAFRGGFPVVHASYRLTGAELTYILEHSQARALIFHPDCWPAVRDAQEKLGAAAPMLVATEAVADAPEVTTVDSLSAGQPTDYPPLKVREVGTPNVVYTSGTTGKPKGAVRDMGRMGLGELNRILERMPYKAGERHMLVAPLYHSGAQAFVMLATAGGATLVVRPHFDAEDCLRTLHDEAVDSVFMVPTMIRRILELPEDVKRRYRPQLSALTSGAAPFAQPLREAAIRYFGPVVGDFYGSTENGWLTFVDSQEMLAKPNSLGRPLAGTRIVILDDAGRPLPPGEIGRIGAVSDQVMEGYFRDDQATADSLVGDALVPGDLGYLDEEGSLFLAGRSHDLIISGGVNVYPAEIEQVLEAFPGVREAAVVGLPDPEWGERVTAIVAGPSADDEAALDAHCRENLAGFKLPRAWFYVDELPRNPTGKVLKRELRERYGSGA